VFTKSSSNLKTLIFISLLALSLPLATNLVQRSSDDRSRATETDKSKINFKIAFKGLKPESSCSASLKTVDLDIVNITKKVYQPGIGTSINPVAGETNSDGDQVFLVSDFVLDNNFKSTDSFNYIQVKNQAYLSARMCFNNQSSKMTTSTACDLPLTNGVTYDFTKYSLTPGDLNQDGIVNASDFSMVKYNVNPSADSQCGQQTDLNYDGITNSFDLTYLKKSLLQTNDEVVIDPTTITPTPTILPTPTLTNTTRSFTAKEYKTMKYWLYTPKGYNQALKWPLIIWLHGAGEVGTNINNLVKSSAFPGLIKNGADYSAIIIAPQYKGGSNAKYNGKSYLPFIKEELIPYLMANYNIDTDRISVVGHSMGANNTAEIGYLYPNYFSCLVPVALCNYSNSWINNLKKENIKVFYGTDDSGCAGDSKNFVNAINKAGGNAAVIVIPKGGHVITNQVFINNKAIEWMIKQVKNKPVVN
jgi:predicted esterase